MIRILLVPALLSLISLPLAAGDAPVAKTATTTAAPVDATKSRLAAITQERKAIEQALAGIRARLAASPTCAEPRAAQEKAQADRAKRWEQDTQVTAARDAAAKADKALQDLAKAKLAAHPEGGKLVAEAAAAKTAADKLTVQRTDLTKHLDRIRTGLDWTDPEVADTREAIEHAQSQLKTLVNPLADAAKAADKAEKEALDAKVASDATAIPLLAKQKELETQLTDLRKQIAACREKLSSDPAIAALGKAAVAARKAESELKTKPEYVAASETVAKATMAHDELVAKKLDIHPEAKPVLDALAKLSKVIDDGKAPQKELDAKLKAVSGELAKNDADLVAAAKARSDTSAAAKNLMTEADAALKAADTALKAAVETALASDAEAKPLHDKLAALKAEVDQLQPPKSKK